MKLILSILETIIAGIIIWKIATPFFFDLAKTNVGNYAYFGLIIFIGIIIILEYASYKKNESTWIATQIITSFLN